MKKVLYVEDSLTSQLLMRKYLQGIAELVMATELRPGAKILKEQTFDLLIADYLFPSGDALGFVHQIRLNPETKDLPIIVVSSSMDEVLVDRVLKAGANEALSKPLNTAKFREIVNRMLEAPYNRKTPGGMVGVSCFQWANESIISQFCPELGVTVTAATKEEASRLMLEEIKARSAQGNVLGFTFQESVIMHRFRAPLEETVSSTESTAGPSALST